MAILMRLDEWGPTLLQTLTHTTADSVTHLLTKVGIPFITP